MEFRILGPLEAYEGERRLPLGGQKQRALLAILLLDVNRAVSVDRLIDALWGDNPPESAVKSIHVHVSRLRRQLGRTLETCAPGYLVRAAPDSFDLTRFETLTVLARSADAEDAASLLRDALALWRGPALAEFVEPFVAIEGGRLEELRLTALEHRIEADLALGRHNDVVGELGGLVAQHPVRERFRAQLMLALYRSGRQAEALAAYQDARRALVEELGIDPGRTLQELERAILVQDSALDVTPASTSLRDPPPPASRSAAVEERKLVTVIVADLGVPIETGPPVDPERLRAMVDAHVATVERVIESSGGTVEQLAGATIMAVFGVPIAHEQDADRALVAALALRAELAAGSGDRLGLRIGIDTGEVITGGGDRVTVTGDAVNLAAQLQQSARSGEILVGERTRLAARGAFVFDSPDRRLPVRGWRVAGRAAAVALGGRETPLVGRRRELAVLRDLFDASTDESRPRLVTIVGDAGVGKSRLTNEFAAGLDDGSSILVGRCLPYGEGVTYWPLREILLSAAGIRLGDAGGTVVGRLRAFVESTLEQADLRADEVARTAAALATTAGISIPEGPLEDMAPESIREELGLAWPRLVSALAREQPTLLVVEDLHWAHAPLLDVLEQVASRSTGRLLVVATARPEFADARPGWNSRGTMTQIALEPLTDHETGDLIDGLTPDATKEVRARILAAAEGNPFFAEELAAHLRDEGDMGASSAVPDSLRGLLAARVDALPSDAKERLQDAAVIGRVFWVGALESLRPGGQLPGVLMELEARGLISTRLSSSLAGQMDIMFRHALTREVAYESIPRARRARTHAGVVEWLERESGDRRDEYVELLAYHYEAAARADDAELAWPNDATHRDEIRVKAVAALVHAGRNAADRFEIDEACAFADRALGLAADDAERLVALELKANAAHAGVLAHEAWGSYLAAIDTAGRIGDEEAAVRLAANATLLWTSYAGAFPDRSWHARARELVGQSLAAVGADSVRFETGALLVGRSSFDFWGLADRGSGDSRRDVERAIEIAEAIDSPWLLAQAIDTLASVAGQDGCCGAAEVGARALEAGQSLADPWAGHEMVVTGAVFLAVGGRFDEAAAAAAEAADRAQRLRTHHRIHGAAAQTMVLLPVGRLDDLRLATAEVPALVEEEGRQTCFYGFAALAAHVLAAFEGGDPSAAVALRLFDEATATVRDRLGFRFVAEEILRPVRGLEQARIKRDTLEPPDTAMAAVRRLRLELQLEPSRGRLIADARMLAGEACAPALGCIADWAEAASLGDVPAARRAIAELAELGEVYTAARLLGDLVHFVGPADGRRALEEASELLAQFGAHASAMAAARAIRGRTRAGP